MAKKEITFRASGNGALMTNDKGTSITEKQLITLKGFEAKVLEGISLTVAQRKTYKELKDKKKAPFQLSTTAKSFVQSTWLANEKGFYSFKKSKFLEKGLYSEEDCISLISKVDGRFYKKNEERITKGNISGECDIDSRFGGRRVIQDTKSTWSPETFMSAKMDLNNEWQGRCYMDLYDADEFWLRHCLVDCPQHIYEHEVYKLKSDYNIIDESLDEHKRLFDRLKTSLIYTDNKSYSLEERVKTTVIYRDDDIFKELLDRIPFALEYYKSLKLNGFNQ